MKIVSKDGIINPENNKVQTPKPQNHKGQSGKPQNVSRQAAAKPRQAEPRPKKNAVPSDGVKGVSKTKPVAKKEVKSLEASSDSLYNRFMSLLRFNITFKLTLGYSIRLIQFIIFFVLLCYGAFTYYLYTDADEKLTHHQKYLKTYMESPSASINEIEGYLSHNDLSLYVFSEDKAPVYKNTSLTMAYEAAIKEERFKIGLFPHLPDAVLYGILKTSPFEKGTYYALRYPRTHAENTISATFPVVIVLVIASMMTAIRSSSRLARKHLKPINTITEQVQEMSANNLSTRLNVSGTKDELKDLALTFNTMLDDIQQSYEREKQFVSDASHELRTPIAVIKGYGGMLKRWGKDDPGVLEESIDAIVGETNNMQSLVESLLFIARNDKGALKMDKEPFNLSHLLEEIVKETHLIDTEHQIQPQIEGNISIFGSAEKIKQALRIFIDNSIKYTPNEGEIRIKMYQNNTSAILSISDNGIGISKEDLPHIFDRFYRADKSRTKMKDNQHGGTGLGLSIAKIIIEQHGGAIRVSSELNVGTEFLIRLPLQGQEPKV